MALLASNVQEVSTDRKPGELGADNRLKVEEASSTGTPSGNSDGLQGSADVASRDRRLLGDGDGSVDASGTHAHLWQKRLRKRAVELHEDCSWGADLEPILADMAKVAQLTKTDVGQSCEAALCKIAWLMPWVEEGARLYSHKEAVDIYEARLREGSHSSSFIAECKGVYDSPEQGLKAMNMLIAARSDDPYQSRTLPDALKDLRTVLMKMATAVTADMFDLEIHMGEALYHMMTVKRILNSRATVVAASGRLTGPAGG